MSKKGSKKSLTILLATLMFVSHLFASTLMVNAAADFEHFYRGRTQMRASYTMLSSFTALQFPRSGIHLPNRRLTAEERTEWIAEYWAMGGAFAFEMEVIRLINEIRAAHGLQLVSLDHSLMMAARFYAQIMSNLNTPLGHNQGPYAIPGATHGASANVASAFGGQLRWNAGNAAAGQGTPHELVHGHANWQQLGWSGPGGWINSPSHSAYILSPEHRFIGTGTHAGGGWGVFHYMFLSDRSSTPRHTATIENGIGAGLFTAGETVSIRANVPYGYRFVRWEGLEDYLNENPTFIMPATEVTIRAIFEPLQPIITFDANGGVDEPEPQTKPSGTELILTSDEPDKEGYTFLGWATTATAYDVEYQSGDTIIRDYDTTLYAVWGQCNPIAEGQFANQSGVDGVAGSKWRVCDHGTLEVDEGFIIWAGSTGPWYEYQEYINNIKITGTITAGSSTRSLFQDLANVEEIEGLTYFDTDLTTNMSAMFYGMSSLIEIDVSGFNTENVSGMSFMFGRMRSLESLDLSGFDTSRVVNMSQMFVATTSLTDLDLSNFDTRNVTNMSEMFSTMSSLENLDVSNFDTSNVVNMNQMFSTTNALESLDLSSFNTTNVTNMGNMFLGMRSLRELTLGSQVVFSGMPNLPAVRQPAEYTERWENGEISLSSAQLTSQFVGATMAGTFVWKPFYDICVVVSEGHFDSDNSMRDSAWTLCDNGVLEIREVLPLIGSEAWHNPWYSYRYQITHIVFTEPVMAEKSLNNLFRDFPNLIEIENLLPWKEN